MSQTYEHCNMAGSVFRDVNLAGAMFEDVNLAGATIRNANLADFRVEDANIKGMTVFGFRVDELIEAERDRRDPQRARLKMRDLYDPEAVREVAARVEELRAAFAALDSASFAADPLYEDLLRRNAAAPAAPLDLEVAE